MKDVAVIPKPNNSKLTVVSSIYYQAQDANPTGVSLRFVKWQNTDEQVYVRTVHVSPSWKKIDSGWIEKCSYLVIDATQSDCDIEIGLRVGETLCAGIYKVFSIKAGQGFQGTPENVSQLELRADKETKCSVYVYPSS